MFHFLGERIASDVIAQKESSFVVESSLGLKTCVPFLGGKLWGVPAMI